MIRPLQPSDIEAITAIEAATQPYSPWSKTIFEDCIRVGYPSWVIEKDGRVAGFLIVLIAAEECHILNIAVDPVFQRQGLARALLDFLFSELQPRHITSVFLEVRASNFPALTLYQQYGFEDMGIRKNYYPGPQNTYEDARVLQKLLL